MTYKQIKTLKSLNKEIHQLSKQYHILYKQEQRISTKNNKIRYSIYRRGTINISGRIPGKWSIKREEIRLRLEKEIKILDKKQDKLATKHKTLINTRSNLRRRCDHKNKKGKYEDIKPLNIMYLYHCNLCNRDFRTEKDIL